VTLQSCADHVPLPRRALQCAMERGHVHQAPGGCADDPKQLCMRAGAVHVLPSAPRRIRRAPCCLIASLQVNKKTVSHRELSSCSLHTAGWGDNMQEALKARAVEALVSRRQQRPPARHRRTTCLPCRCPAPSPQPTVRRPCCPAALAGGCGDHWVARRRRPQGFCSRIRRGSGCGLRAAAQHAPRSGLRAGGDEQLPPPSDAHGGGGAV
jgi:hypothetical protein